MDIPKRGWLLKQPIQRTVRSKLKKSFGKSKRRYFVLFRSSHRSNFVYFTNEKMKKEKGRLIVTATSTVQRRLATASFEVRTAATTFALLCLAYVGHTYNFCFVFCVVMPLDCNALLQLVDDSNSVFVARAESEEDAAEWVDVLQTAINQHQIADSPQKPAAVGASAQPTANHATPVTQHTAAVTTTPARSTPHAHGHPVGGEAWAADLQAKEAHHVERLAEIKALTKHIKFHDKTLEDFSSDEESDDSSEEYIDEDTSKLLTERLTLQFELEELRKQLRLHGYSTNEDNDPADDENDASADAAAADEQIDDDDAAAPATAEAEDVDGEDEEVDQEALDKAAAEQAELEAKLDPAERQWLRTQQQLEKMRNPEAAAKMSKQNASKPQQQQPAATSQATSARKDHTATSATTSATKKEGAEKNRTLESEKQTTARGGQQTKAPVAKAGTGRGNGAVDTNAQGLEIFRLKQQLETLQRKYDRDLAASAAREAELASTVAKLREEVSTLRAAAARAEVESAKQPDPGCKCVVT